MDLSKLVPDPNKGDDTPSGAPDPNPDIGPLLRSRSDGPPAASEPEPVPPGRVDRAPEGDPSERLSSISSVDPSQIQEARTLGIDPEDDEKATEEISSSFGVEFAEGFTRENMLSSFIRRNQDRPGALTNAERQRWLSGDFDALEEIKGTKYEKKEYLDDFATVRSKRELDWMKKVIDREEQSNEIIARGGTGKAIVSGMAGAIFDPIMAPTLAVPSVRASAVTRAAYTGGTAAALSGVTEYGLHQSQATRTETESAINVGASALLGSVLGSVMGPRVGADEAADLHTKIADDLTEEPVFKESTTVDITEMDWNEIRKFAKGKGVSAKGKRADIEARLREAGINGRESGMEAPLAPDEFYHGGDFTSGKLDRPLYVTKEYGMANSYLPLGSSNSPNRVKIPVSNPAPQEEVLQVADDLGFNRVGGIDDSPAMVFETESYGNELVNELVNRLRAKGYDHAVMDDYALTPETPDFDESATIIFPGTEVTESGAPAPGPTNVRQLYHAGEFKGGDVKGQPLFTTEDRSLAEYYGMEGETDLHLLDFDLKKGASEDTLIKFAKDLGVEADESWTNIPANLLDAVHTDPQVVDALIARLKDEGYDHVDVREHGVGYRVSEGTIILPDAGAKASGRQSFRLLDMDEIETREGEGEILDSYFEATGPAQPQSPDRNIGAAQAEDGSLPPGFKADIDARVDAGLMSRREAARAIRDKQLEWTALKNEGMFKPFKFASPVLRVGLSKSAKARVILENLIEDSFIRSKNEYGHTSDFAVETIAKSRSHIYEVAAHDIVGDSYSKYVKATRAKGATSERGATPKVMSRQQFSEEVGKAMARGDDHTIPEVAAAAKSIRSNISEPIERELINEKLISVDADGNPKAPKGGDKSYFPRVYNWTKIAADRAGFKRHLIDRIRGRIERAHFKKGDNLEKLEEFDSEVYQMQLHARLDETIEKILGSPNGYMPKNVVPSTGFLKDRKIELGFDDLEPYLITDATQVQRAYVQNMVPQLEIKKRFSDIELEDEVAAVNKEYVDKMAELEPNSKQMAAMEKERKQVIDDIRAMRDILLHRFERPRNPSSVWNKAGHFVRSANFMRYLGGVTISSLPDLGQVVARQGLRPVASSFMKLAASPRAMGIGRQEAKRMAAGLDAVLHTRANLLMMASDDAVSPAGKVNRAMDTGVRTFSKMTGMAYWNSGLKQFAAIIYADEIGRLANKTINGKGLSKGEITRLASARIGQDEWDLIARNFAKHGTKESGLYIPNIDQWDPDAKDMFSSALLKEVDSSVIAPGAGDLPLVARTPVGKVISQFKSFILTAHNKIFLAGMQRGLLDGKGAADQLAGFMTMMGLGTMAYAMKNYAAGREVETENYNTLIRESLNHSGYFGYLMELNNLTEKTTRGTMGLSAAFGAMGAGDPEPLTRFHTRSVVEDLLGPTMGTATDTAIATSAVINGSLGGEISEHDMRAMRRLIPFQNLIYIRRALDAAEESAADKWAD